MIYIILDEAGKKIVNDFNDTHEQKAIICSTSEGEGIVEYTFEFDGYEELVEPLKDYPRIDIKSQWG